MMRRRRKRELYESIITVGHFNLSSIIMYNRRQAGKGMRKGEKWNNTCKVVLIKW